MKALLIAIAIAHGADATTTALARHRGAVEMNLFLPQSIAANVAAQIGLTSLQIYQLHHLAQTKPRLARALSVAAFGMEVSAASYNVHVSIQMGR